MLYKTILIFQSEWMSVQHSRKYGLVVISFFFLFIKSKAVIIEVVISKFDNNCNKNNEEDGYFFSPNEKHIRKKTKNVHLQYVKINGEESLATRYINLNK